MEGGKGSAFNSGEENYSLWPRDAQVSLKHIVSSLSSQLSSVLTKMDFLKNQLAKQTKILENIFESLKKGHKDVDSGIKDHPNSDRHSQGDPAKMDIDDGEVWKSQDSDAK
eukprot:Gb_11214 [translate_table: standard]